MTALTAPRITPSLATGKDTWTTHPVAANKIVYPGAQVAINASGNLVPATASATLKVLGVASPKGHQLTRFGPAATVLGYIDTTGLADGAVECTVQRCIGLMKNEGSSITKAEIGKDCFAVDDQTVAKTDGGVAQVTEATVVFDNGSATGFTIDGVDGVVTVNAATSATATATALASKANNNVQFAALYSASTNGTKVIVAKKTAGTFTLTKQVSGAADLTPITTTTAGAATTRSRAGRIHDVETRGVWVEYDAA
jgi:hypothetical protein